MASSGRSPYSSTPYWLQVRLTGFWVEVVFQVRRVRRTMCRRNGLCCGEKSRAQPADTRFVGLSEFASQSLPEAMQRLWQVQRAAKHLEVAIF